MQRFVTIKKYADDAGLSARAVESMIERGDMIEGLHYRRRPGSRRIMIDRWVMDAWHQGATLQELKYTAELSASGSAGAALVAESR